MHSHWGCLLALQKINFWNNVWAHFGSHQDFDNWNNAWGRLELTKIFYFWNNVLVHTEALQFSLSVTFFGPRNGAHQDIQSMKQYLTWAHFGAFQDFGVWNILGPILELTKILDFWNKFGSILELTKIFNLWYNTCLGHILISGTGPIYDLTKIFNF